MAKVKIRDSFWEHPFCIPFSRDLAPHSIFDKHKDYLIFDIETKNLAPRTNNLDDFAALGVSVACAWDSRTQEMLTFFEDKMDDFVKLLGERLVIGYNIRRFDLPVMRGYGLKMNKIDYFDLMDEVERGLGRRWIKLEYLAQGTLGEGKSGDGKVAVQWYKEGRFEELAEYCARDVEVTKDIFQFGLENNFLRVQFPEKDPQEIRVDWR